MLSLNKTNFPIARAYNPKKKSDYFMVYINPNISEQPDIITESKKLLITETDKDRIERLYSLSLTDIDDVMEIIDTKAIDTKTLKHKIRKGYRKINQFINNKLKNELDLRGTPYILEPIYIPHPANEYMGSFFTAGSTGSGKTRFTNDTLMKIWDSDKKKKPIYLFSRVKNDKSLNGIRKLAKKKFKTIDLEEIMEQNDDDDCKDMGLSNTLNPLADYAINTMDCKLLPSMEDLQHSYVIVDDIDTLKDRDLTDELYELIRDILECGRHEDISLFLVRHIAQGDRKKTKYALNESRYITLFPKSNYHACSLILQARFGLNFRRRSEILKTMKETGRAMNIHTFSPNYILIKKLIYLF